MSDSKDDLVGSWRRRCFCMLRNDRMMGNRKCLGLEDWDRVQINTYT